MTSLSFRFFVWLDVLVLQCVSLRQQHGAPALALALVLPLPSDGGALRHDVLVRVDVVLSSEIRRFLVSAEVWEEHEYT